MRLTKTRIWAYISGDPRLFAFEHQIFNSVLFFGAMASFPLPIINLFMGYGPELVLYTTVFCLFCCTAFYYSRIRNKFKSVVFPITVVLVVLMAIIWIYNGGTVGGAQYFYFPVALVIAVISKGKQRVVLLSLFLSVSLSMIVLEYLYPEIIHDSYNSRLSRYSNVAVSFIYSVLSTSMVAVIVMRRYVSEREKNHKLLLNILPPSVAVELNQYGKTKPVSYELATVMFADFVDFTKIAEQLDHNSLLAELDNSFSFFDSITKKYNLEKIKTIGDSYMVCSGLPVVNRTNPIDCALAALEIKHFIEEQKRKCACHFTGIRIGIHSGPLIAGVIGSLKFSYDVFGDTVNTASRIESTGISREINVSEKTYLLIKDFFECEHRGLVALKGKKECSVYILKGIKPELSVKGEGLVPNKDFFRELESVFGQTRYTSIQ